MLKPPIKPMLAKIASELPPGEDWLFEPKWDGFRALVFRSEEGVELQSRDLKPLGRYFPELEAPLRAQLAPGCVLDGEIVIAGGKGLDFDALLQRIHPAASRIARLASETPAAFIAFDLLAEGSADLRGEPQSERRRRLEHTLRGAASPLFLTPATRDRALAQRWFERFEGAGLDGVIAKRLDLAYAPDKRVLLKIKHERTADCVVAGFRWHKSGPGTAVGSLLLGLHDAAGALQHVGVTSSFKAAERIALAGLLAPLREGAEEVHPWLAVQAEPGAAEHRKPGGPSRWNRGKSLDWEPLRPELCCEVAYDHLQGDRFRHATTFRRWRSDKDPADCTYSQLEEVAPADLPDLLPGL